MKLNIFIKKKEIKDHSIKRCGKSNVGRLLFQGSYGCEPYTLEKWCVMDSHGLILIVSESTCEQSCFFNAAIQQVHMS
jgi:hypothetical protein